MTEFDDSLRVILRGRQCIYCGEYATTREHFPPKSYTRTGIIIPACLECNTFAGTAWGTDFEERVAHVKNKIRSRYSEYLNAAAWGDDEIAELEYNLATGVKVWMQIRKIILERLAWNAVSYLAVIDNGHDFVVAAAEMHSIIKSEKQHWRNSNLSVPQGITRRETWKQKQSRIKKHQWKPGELVLES